jgi:prolyl 4-hydroxylase
MYSNSANPKYMKKDCAPACKSCDYLSIEVRCPLDPDAPNAWSAGDLNAMFVRLSSEPYLSMYEAKVLSSPDTTGGPWVITMENVVTAEEAEHLIELGSIEGYERSGDVGKLKPDGTFDAHINSGRTSTNAWCEHECYKNETALAVMARLSNITGIIETNSEFLQLLRYEEGQHYQVHHDYIAHDMKRYVAAC